MKYEQDILNVLFEAGNDGLSIKKIARHVYNANNSLFEETSYEDVYKIVLAYIAKCKKSRDAAIESTGQRGHYRLNMSSGIFRQLILNFEENTKEEEIPATNDTCKDQSLSLF